MSHKKYIQIQALKNIRNRLRLNYPKRSKNIW